MNINFLPWREQMRRQKIFFVLLGGAAVVAILYTHHFFSVLERRQHASIEAYYHRLQRVKMQTKSVPLAAHNRSPKSSLQSRWFALKHVDAKYILKLFENKNKYVFSTRSSLLADERTNSLFVRALPDELSMISGIIQHLDVVVPQILIEAQIVNMDYDYEKSLGVRFGLTVGKDLSVNAPIANANSLGVALLNLTQGTQLDLELSALETQGKAQIISNPKLLTENQTMATIEAGEEIPYQESVSQGMTTTAFKKAVLQLQVTPQIQSDHKILLRLKVNQDKRSSQEIQGVPAIDTRQMTTQVLVNDGHTVVLGGIYEYTDTQAVENIPFISNLPFLGKLFQHHKNTKERKELLIFVTPRIVPS